MTLRAYLRIARERWRLIAAVTLLGIIAAALLTIMTPKTYQASVQIFVTPNTAVTAGNGLYDQQAAVLTQVSTFAEMVGSKDVLQGIKDELHLSMSTDELAGKLNAAAPTQQSLIILDATDGDPAFAAQLANTAATHFAQFIEKNTTPAGEDHSSVRLVPTRPATVPSSPVSPTPALNVALGLLLGLFAGIALAIARDVLDTRIKDIDVLSSAAHAPALGLVVEDPTAQKHSIASRGGPRSIRAENFRQIRAGLQFANLDSSVRVIAVTSCVSGEGKTTVAVNLAAALAEAGLRVCIVDADLRKPSVADAMGLPAPVGLTNVLVGQVDLDDALQVAEHNLVVLTAGVTPPNPSELLASPQVRRIVATLRERFDYVILDSAPLLPVADGSEVAALVDGCVLVARNRITTTTQIKRGIATLNRVEATLLGVVLNRVPRRQSGEYGYGYQHDEPSAVGPLAPGSRSGSGRRGMPETISRPHQREGSRSSKHISSGGGS